jgi:hypothetical protein
MMAMQAASIANSTFPLPPPSRSTRKSSSERSRLHWLHAPPDDGLPSAGLDFLLQMHLRRERIAKKAQTTSMPQRRSSMPRRQPTRKSSSKESLSFLHWLHAPQDDALPSSGLDFLQEIYLRRERTNAIAQKATRKKRTMILLEQALEIIDADWRNIILIGGRKETSAIGNTSSTRGVCKIGLVGVLDVAVLHDDNEVDK